jgi:hypothetical protein
MGKIPTPTKSEKGKKVDWSEEMNEVAAQNPAMPTPCKDSNTDSTQPEQNGKAAADQDPSSPSSDGGDVFLTARNSPQPKSQATSLASGSPVMKGNEDMNGNGTSPGFGNRTDHFDVSAECALLSVAILTSQQPVLAEIKAKLDKTQQCSRPESLVETPEDVQRDAERRKDNLVVSSQPKKLEPKKLNPGVPAFIPAPPAVNTESMVNTQPTFTTLDILTFISRKMVQVIRLTERRERKLVTRETKRRRQKTQRDQQQKIKGKMQRNEKGDEERRKQRKKNSSVRSWPTSKLATSLNTIRTSQK